MVKDTKPGCWPSRHRLEGVGTFLNENRINQWYRFDTLTQLSLMRETILLSPLSPVISSHFVLLPHSYPFSYLLSLSSLLSHFHSYSIIFSFLSYVLATFSSLSSFSSLLYSFSSLSLFPNLFLFHD